MNRNQAAAVLVLFDSKHFDTADIAELLGLKEAEVSRTLTASRDVVRELFRQHVGKPEIQKERG
jgi:DNA-directed RNA polymerase specialized sigma24 family protein